MTGLRKTGGRIAASLAVAGLLAGCVTPNPETARVVAAPKTPAVKNLTSFSQALRCMDDLFLAYGKQDIVVTTAGIPDSTGRVAAGTKEMLISGISKMSVKSKAITFIDYDTEKNDLLMLFQDVQAAGGGANRKLPSYYIRGAITQLDDNALDSQAGASIALPFADLGVSKDQMVSLVSLDMNVGETASRQILPGVGAANTMAITRAGMAGDAGGKIGKAGISINLSLNKSEGMGAAVRALVELGLIETMGKLTNVPYWKCLEIDKTNPVMMEQARDWFDGMTEKDRVLFVQRKLSGAGLYNGAASGNLDRPTIDAVSRYQADNGLIANGRVDFDLYYTLLDGEGQMAPGGAQQAVLTAPAKSQKPQGSGAVELTMTTDRGSRPVYRPKESLQASVTMSRDGFLHCYYKDAGGSIARVFPNRFQPDSFVKGGKSVSIPGEGTPFKIRFDRSGAREQVFCLGSDREVALPTNLKAGDLMPLKVSSTEEVISAFKKSNPLVGEAKLDISVQ